MRLLLDTHVLIWWLAASPHVPSDVRDVIAAGDNQILVSAVTAFEISTKKSLGKLDAPDDLEKQIEAAHFTALPVTVRHGLEAGRLPWHHRDPFDRLLVAQARCDDLTLVTADRVLLAYDVRRLMIG